MRKDAPRSSAGEPSRLRDWFAAGSAAVVKAILPSNCLACGRPILSEGGLCSSCWSRLTLIERPFCERLAIPFTFDLGEGAISAEAIADPPPFERLRAVVLYDDIARQLVHGVKYRDHLEMVRWMARWMARAGGELIVDADLIVPVPLHWRAQWWRRFNQSAALAASISDHTGKLSLLDAVRRVRSTGHQVGLGRNAREANVRGAFRVAPEHRLSLAGRRVLLVDDVYTTGATTKAVTKALKQSGADVVDALVFARVARGQTERSIRTAVRV